MSVVGVFSVAGMYVVAEVGVMGSQPCARLTLHSSRMGGVIVLRLRFCPASFIRDVVFCRGGMFVVSDGGIGGVVYIFLSTFGEWWHWSAGGWAAWRRLWACRRGAGIHYMFSPRPNACAQTTRTHIARMSLAVCIQPKPEPVTVMYDSI